MKYKSFYLQEHGVRGNIALKAVPWEFKSDFEHVLIFRGNLETSHAKMDLNKRTLGAVIITRVRNNVKTRA